MASAGAYNGGLGAKPSTGVQGAEPIISKGRAMAWPNVYGHVIACSEFCA